MMVAARGEEQRPVGLCGHGEPQSISVEGLRLLQVSYPEVDVSDAGATCRFCLELFVDERIWAQRRRAHRDPGISLVQHSESQHIHVVGPHRIKLCCD